MSFLINTRIATNSEAAPQKGNDSTNPNLPSGEDPTEPNSEIETPESKTTKVPIGDDNAGDKEDTTETQVEN